MSTHSCTHTHWTHTHSCRKDDRPACALCCTLSTDGARVKDTNESNETEGKTAPEIYTTAKHLREAGWGGGCTGSWKGGEWMGVGGLQKLQVEREKGEKGDAVKERKWEN